MDSNQIELAQPDRLKLNYETLADLIQNLNNKKPAFLQVFLD